LRAKVAQATSHGFEVDPAELNPQLKEFTRAMVRWMLAGGRRALFASFGLHKTCAQIECMRLIGKHHSGIRLITLPLGVRPEFFNDAARFFTGEYSVQLKFIRRVDEIRGRGIHLPHELRERARGHPRHRRDREPGRREPGRSGDPARLRRDEDLPRVDGGVRRRRQARQEPAREDRRRAVSIRGHGHA
jgi:hypothetical protein